jgi:predicted GNAT superfamily acetyltransferase
MNREFTPYDRALKLKELGFNEPCFAFRKDPDMIFIAEYNQPAPTFSQAFRWFRENYKINSHVDRGFKDEYYYTILENGKNYPISGFYNNSYEEAEIACLDKLIEIVESKNK